ncbi:DUF554 family protein [Aquipuribacter sp. MA13-6]|uniref:DUF554 family protein n=1 Tax=unclassified Aquipuribacter TaxID=2635084 RepID=UPI003EE88E91
MTLFIGAGTVLNVLTVLLGGTVGLLLGSRLPERVRLVAMDALGLGTLSIAVLSILDVTSPELTDAVGPGAALVVIGSALLGGIIGALLRVESRLEQLGHVLRAVLLRGRAAPEADGDTEAHGSTDAGSRTARGDTRFVEGFVTASLVFCVGPLTVLGSINDGLGRGIDELAVKSLLDGVAAAAFASALGSGVLLSALSVAVVQGTLTLVGFLLGDLLDAAQVAALSATGGLVLLGVGLRLLRLRDVPVGDLLPALVVAPVLVAGVGAFVT